MREVGEDSYYYFYNGHADVTALMDTLTGNISATYYYDAFGNILESTGSASNSVNYAGYQYDQESGYYYLNARMYEPEYIVELKITNNPTVTGGNTVKPAYGGSGGGREYFSENPVQIDIINYQK